MENTGGEEGEGKERQGRKGGEKEKGKVKEEKQEKKRRKSGGGSTTRQTSKGYSQNFFLFR